MARKFTESFIGDMKILGIKAPDSQPKVTEHIPEIIETIEALIKKEAAYATEKGNVYYDLTRSKNKIGILSHQTVEGLLEGSGSRIEVEDDKRYQLDFVLWKSSPESEIGWNSPWGRGRPGWHIECTVMSMKYGSQQLDIHGGGMDLIFPHHEAEILQSESYTGKYPFSKYWLHNGFLTINKEKMSKSLGNFFTIKEVLSKFSPATIRFFIVYTHYRNTIDFSEENLEEASRARKRIVNTINNVRYALKEALDDKNDYGLYELTCNAKEAFINSMDEDFNTRDAIGNLFVFTRKVNSIISEEKPCKDALEKVLEFFAEVEEVFGIFAEDEQGIQETVIHELSEEEIMEMIELREKARQEKNWAKADAIREDLKQKGIIIENSKDGVRWRRI